MHRDKRKGSSPIPQSPKRMRTGKTVSRTPPESDGINRIGKLANSLAKTGMIAEPDKNTSMKDISRSIFSSIGAGVVDTVSTDSVKQDRAKRKVSLKTNFSLMQTETDRTVIPNQEIADLKSIKKQFAKTPMIPATAMFHNFEENTLFTPKPQEELKKVFLTQQRLKAAQTSNLIDIAGDLIDFQNDLRSDVKLSTFKLTQKKVNNPNIDNSNYEFKDYSDPNIFWDDDDPDEIEI